MPPEKAFDSAVFRWLENTKTNWSDEDQNNNQKLGSMIRVYIFPRDILIWKIPSNFIQYPNRQILSKFKTNRRPMLLALLLFAFDGSHCKRKCEVQFAESPTKKSLCLEVCSDGIGARERVQFGQPEMKKQVVSCLARCNQNVNSTADFHSWAKCRQSCARDPETDEIAFISDRECGSGCDRYWKGTVHWPPCQDQCKDFARAERLAREKPPNPRPVW
jgi:hypothetical protein